MPGRRSTLEGYVRISWQAQYFGGPHADLGAMLVESLVEVLAGAALWSATRRSVDDHVRGRPTTLESRETGRQAEKRDGHAKQIEYWLVYRVREAIDWLDI